MAVSALPKSCYDGLPSNSSDRTFRLLHARPTFLQPHTIRAQRMNKNISNHGPDPKSTTHSLGGLQAHGASGAYLRGTSRGAI